MIRKRISRENAIDFARAHSRRDLVESENRISYIGFVAEFQDFCLCEWNLLENQKWAFSCRALPIERRLPEEQITDSQIIEVARSGNTIQAIRLYRTKYDTGLAEAKTGVEGLLNIPITSVSDTKERQ